MIITELGWIVGLHLVLAVWLGLLASAWKGRSTYTWIAIGLLTSIMGLLLLVRLNRQKPRVELDMQLQHLDGTRLQ